jgi:peptidoglycan/xylan/chitin deacetylase (PgdA/CDA1 family)
MLMRTAIRALSGSKERAKLSIFIFHRVLPVADPFNPDAIDRQRFGQMLDWIGDWFRVLPLSDAVAALRSGTLPSRPAAITFDDGYADNLTVAAPCLLERGMTATFFIATGFLDGGRMFNDTVTEAFRRTPLEHIDLSGVGLGKRSLGSLAERRHAIGEITESIKYRPLTERADALKFLELACGAALPDDLMMTSDQLRSLAAMGMEIGAHTVNHPILAVLDPVSAEREIVQSRETLEDLIGSPVRAFAYPNGAPGRDYLPEHSVLVSRLGFQAAVSTAWGTGHRGSDPFQLPRFTPWDLSKNAFFARTCMNLLDRVG